MEYKCEFCNSILKNAYTLKSHINGSKKCLKLRGLKLDSTIVCNGCKLSLTNKYNLSVHQENCKEYSILILKNEFNEKIKQIEEKHENDIKERENSLLNNNKLYQKEIEFLKDELDKLRSSYENITKEAINRPTISTTNNTINNIRNILSTRYTVDNLKYDDLLLIFKENLTEEILLGGQEAIAKICSEKIIHTNDNKKRLVCTDTSRDKYKCMDEKGNVKEDIHARNFTNKIIKPLETVGQDVYDTACATIAEERENLSSIDYGKKASLRNKEDRLLNSLFEIKSIDRPEYNSKFLSELSILTKV